jgi:hypothetical protein
MRGQVDIKRQARHDHLWAFVNERDAIYKRRLAGQPFPWTDDPILRSYRFGNVYRDLDPATLLVRTTLHAREPIDQLSGFIAFRRHCRFELLDIELPHHNHSDVDRYYDRITTAWNSGRAVGAKTHNPESIANSRRVLHDLVDRFKTLPTDDGVIDQLRAVWGIGTFYLVQAIADLAPLLDSPDPRLPLVGPGASAGLLYLLDGTHPLTGRLRTYNRSDGQSRRVGSKISRPSAAGKLRPALLTELDVLHETQPKLEIPLRFIDLEHVLCEFSRYVGHLESIDYEGTTKRARPMNGRYVPPEEQ